MGSWFLNFVFISDSHVSQNDFSYRIHTFSKMILDLKEVEGGTWYPWYWRQMYHLFAHCPPSPLGIILILSLLLWCMACISRSQMLNADAVELFIFHFSLFVASFHLRWRQTKKKSVFIFIKNY